MAIVARAAGFGTLRGEFIRQDEGAVALHPEDRPTARRNADRSPGLHLARRSTLQSATHRETSRMNLNGLLPRIAAFILPLNSTGVWGCETPNPTAGGGA